MNDILSWAVAQDVSELSEFLKKDNHKLLICFGSGGSTATCRYLEMMYEAGGGFAKTVTPYTGCSLPQETLKSAKLLMISNSGHGVDIEQMAKYAFSCNPDNTASFSTDDSDDNKLKKILKHNFIFANDVEEGFVSTDSNIANFALFYKAFTGKDAALGDISLDLGGQDFTGIKHIIAIHGPWGEAAAWNLECQMVESGVATCTVVDFKNFCHGRFIFPANHSCFRKTPADCLLVMFVTPREQPLVERLHKLLPEQIRIVELTSENDSPIATLEFMIKETQLADKIAADNGQSLLNPKNPSGINKHYPRNQAFITDLRNAGPIKL